MTVHGNTRLVPYGIQTERSDLRAHVCILARALYVYPTRCGVACLSDPRWREVPAKTGALVTAMGRLVPPTAINECMRVDIPDSLIVHANIQETQSTTEKGTRAMHLVAAMIRDALFPFPLDPTIITDTNMQFEGLDIVVATRVRIQVKLDFRGGERELGGTGNLFLQTAECNPTRSY
jgi:hypothetical protein